VEVPIFEGEFAVGEGELVFALLKLPLEVDKLVVAAASQSFVFGAEEFELDAELLGFPVLFGLELVFCLSLLLFELIDEAPEGFELVLILVVFPLQGFGHLQVPLQLFDLVQPSC
jgi:hypothetical protein